MIEALNSSLLNELRSLSHDVEEKLTRAEERGNTSRLELLQNLQQMETAVHNLNSKRDSDFGRTYCIAEFASEASQ